jgi:hypothetical protein
MRKLHWIIGLVLLCGPAAAAPATPGVTTISNPGGGTIAYAQLPQQHDAQGAMSKVLQYVEGSLGARPDVSKFMKSPDGNSLAATFTLTKNGKQIAGLALVAVSKTGPGAGAVLSDTADHFRTSLQPMLTRLQQEAIAKGGSTGAQAAIANAGGSSGSDKSVAPASKTASKTGSYGGPVPDAPAEKLTPTPLPGGTGSIALPAGWRITAYYDGDVAAQGPKGESLRFGMPEQAMNRSGGTGSGDLLNIPFGVTGDVANTALLDQLAMKQRRPPLSIAYTTVKPMPDDGKGKNWLLISNSPNVPGGPTVSWTEISMGMLGANGIWSMTVYGITVPQALANHEAATVDPLFGGYKPNYGAIMANIGRENVATKNAFVSSMQYAKQSLDSSARSTQATTNYLLNQTVVSDGALGGHGTVSDDVADALIRAYPDRYQAVSPGSYVRGIDY